MLYGTPAFIQHFTNFILAIIAAGLSSSWPSPGGSPLHPDFTPHYPSFIPFTRIIPQILPYPPDFVLYG